MQRQQGYTFVELMLVVSIISTISAFTVPNIVNAKKRANEVTAISSLRAIVVISEFHRARFGTYAEDLGAMWEVGLVNRHLGVGRKSGYSFAYEGTADAWECYADPAQHGVTGDRHFFVDQSGVIHYNQFGGASPDDLPLD